MSFNFDGNEIEFSLFSGDPGGFSWTWNGNKWISEEISEDKENGDIIDADLEDTRKKVLFQFRRVLEMRHKPEWSLIIDKKGNVKLPDTLPRELFETLKAILNTILNKSGIEYNVKWPGK